MSNAKYGEHGKIYSRKRRYYKKGLYSQPAGQSKSQMAEKSQIAQGMPAVNPSTYLVMEEKMISATIRAKKRAIKEAAMLEAAMLLCIGLVIGGLVIRMVLLYGR